MHLLDNKVFCKGYFKPIKMISLKYPTEGLVDRAAVDVWRRSKHLTKMIDTRIASK